MKNDKKKAHENQDYRVVAYIRESTEEQGIHGYRPEVQQERIVSYCDFHGFKLIQTFSDWGSGGSTKQRPNFLKMLNFAKTNDIRFIVIEEVSRFFRGVHECLNFEKELEDDHNIFVIDTRIDSNPREYVDKGIPNWIWSQRMNARTNAELERREIQTRVTQGIHKKRDRGQYTGPICYGLEWCDPDKKYVRYKPDEAKIVKEIFKLYLTQRFGFTSLARHLNVDKNYSRPVVKKETTRREDGTPHIKRSVLSGKFTNDLIRKILTNKTYMGIQNSGENKSLQTLNARNQPAQLGELIEVDDFNQVQEIIRQHTHGGAARDKKTSRQKRVFLFQGMLRHAETGDKMYGHTEIRGDGTEVRRYLSEGNKKGITKVPSVHADDVEMQIIELLKAIKLKNIESIESELRDIVKLSAAAIREAKRSGQLNTKHAKRLKVLEEMQADDYSWQVQEMVEKLKKCIDEESQTDKKRGPAIVKYYDFLELRSVLSDLSLAFQEMQDLAAKQGLIQMLFKHIFLAKPKLPLLPDKAKGFKSMRGAVAEGQDYQDTMKLRQHLKQFVPALFEEIQVCAGKKENPVTKVIFKPTGLFLLVTDGMKDTKKKS